MEIKKLRRELAGSRLWASASPGSRLYWMFKKDEWEKAVDAYAERVRSIGRPEIGTEAGPWWVGPAFIATIFVIFLLIIILL